MPLRVCQDCRRAYVPSEGRKGRCRPCYSTMERERSRRRRAEGKGGRAVYDSKRWGVVRARVLADSPLCAHCAERSVETLATQVDHITPLSEGGDPFDPKGLQALCDQCHWLKSARESRDRAALATPRSQRQQTEG